MTIHITHDTLIIFSVDISLYFGNIWNCGTSVCRLSFSIDVQFGLTDIITTLIISVIHMISVAYIKKGNIANNNEKVQMIITIIIFSLQERRCWQNWVVFLCHNLEQCCICTITDVKMLMFLMLIFCVAKFIQTHTNHCILFRSYIKLMSVQGKFLHCIYANMQTWIQQKLKHTN